MAMEPASQETTTRYRLASEWHRKQCPVASAGEDLLARLQQLEERHAIERQQFAAQFARYLTQQVRPLEYRKHAKDGAPSDTRDAA